MCSKDKITAAVSQIIYHISLHYNNYRLFYILNKSLSQWGNLPEEQLKFFILIHPNEIVINWWHLRGKKILWVIIDRSAKHKMNRGHTINNVHLPLKWTQWSFSMVLIIPHTGLYTISLSLCLFFIQEKHLILISWISQSNLFGKNIMKMNLFWAGMTILDVSIKYPFSESLVRYLHKSIPKPRYPTFMSMAVNYRFPERSELLYNAHCYNLYVHSVMP